MDILATALVIAAVVAWTAWESTMVARLRQDTRPLRARNAAVAGAHRLSVVAHLGLVALAVVAAVLAAVPLWWRPASVAGPLVGGLATAVLIGLAAAAAWWASRRGPAAQDRRALAAVAATALSTEVLLRGLGLGLLEQAGSPVTVAVLVTAVLTGLLQAWRSSPGSRAYGFVLATVLGFGLGLVVVLTGSILAAAAVHVTVVVLGLARTFPDRDHAAGCACGGHDHAAPTEQAAGTAPAAPVASVTGASAGADVPASAAAGDTPQAAAAHSHAADSHASCGSTCDHAGTSACAVCPLSTARV